MNATVGLLGSPFGASRESKKQIAIILALILAVIAWATTITYSFANGASATFTSSGGTWSASNSLGESYSGLSGSEASALLADWTAAFGGREAGQNSELS
jgi:hypothetical protein